MAPFPESAVLGWIVGMAIAVVLVACMVVGLMARYWRSRRRRR